MEHEKGFASLNFTGIQKKKQREYSHIPLLAISFIK